MDVGYGSLVQGSHDRADEEFIEGNACPNSSAVVQVTIQ